jgi:hypothetical protein
MPETVDDFMKRFGSDGTTMICHSIQTLQNRSQAL